MTFSQCTMPFRFCGKLKFTNFSQKVLKKKETVAFVNNLKWRNNLQEKLQTVILNTLMKHRIFCKDKLMYKFLKESFQPCLSKFR